MKISPITNNFYNNRQSVNFKSSTRVYSNSYGDKIGCHTLLFRDDLDWKKFTKFIADSFKDKDKVNIVMYASSDGSEAYTTIMSLFEHFKNEKEVEKFFPIEAHDVDNEILKAAQGGYLNIGKYDKLMLSLGVKKYTDYFSHSDKKLILPNDNKLMYMQTLKTKDKLSKNVNFSYGDMFEGVRNIRDNSNTILMCRNILGYFVNKDVEKFIQSASMTLKKGSLFLIGDYDIKNHNINSLMEKYGFREFIHNVYKKM